jgi:hypothetical protein
MNHPDRQLQPVPERFVSRGIAYGHERVAHYAAGLRHDRRDVPDAAARRNVLSGRPSLMGPMGTKLARFEQGAPMGGVSRNSESNYAQRVTGLADDLHRTECLGRGSLRLVIRHTTAQRLYTAFPVRRFISGDE